MSKGQVRTPVVLREKLKALGNRYAADILTVLSPQTADVVSTYSWEEIVDGILSLIGVSRPIEKEEGLRTQAEADYEGQRKKLISGGTLYETMSKLVSAGFVLAVGEKKKKKRSFMITRDGRLALAALHILHEITDDDTEVQRAAKTLLRFKNFIQLLPAQEKFIHEVGDVRENLMIQMPPGSGKTFLAMIVILMALKRGERCIYLTPYISLNRQIMDEYENLFRTLGYSVIRLDGMRRVSKEELNHADLIIAIFENFLTSKLRNDKWTKDIRLAVIDEITELNSSIDEVSVYNLGSDRSTRLDVLISLLRPNTRIITLSSRFGHTEMVSKWLDARIFRPEARITPDEYIVETERKHVRICSSDNSHTVIIDVQDPLEAVFRHIESPEKKSVLIVVGTRVRAEGMARYMAENHARQINMKLVRNTIETNDDTPAANRLFETLSKGVAFHHAGLTPDVRGSLERLIRQRVVRTVVSTTGITAGISFPLDIVIILVDGALINRITRSKYLQIAGRIGEYYLASRGGRVYLILEEPSERFPNTKSLAKVLFKQPLQSLKPGDVYPQLAISLLNRCLSKSRFHDPTKLKSEIMDVISRTLRGTYDKEYIKRATQQISKLIKWLQKKDVLQPDGKGLYLSKDARIAVKVDINLIEYIESRDVIHELQESSSDDDLIYLVLKFSQPQSIRPRTTLPSQFEIELMGVDGPSDRYVNMVGVRNRIKYQVLLDWINERPIKDIIAMVHNQVPNVAIDERDLRMFVDFCSDIIQKVSLYYLALKEEALSERLERFSNRLKYGVKEDLANTDLFNLRVPSAFREGARILSREEARILADHGYRTIEEIVRRDIDHTKPGTARTRFAKNCGLDNNFAKSVYRSAIEYYRSRREID